PFQYGNRVLTVQYVERRARRCRNDASHRVERQLYGSAESRGCKCSRIPVEGGYAGSRNRLVEHTVANFTLNHAVDVGKADVAGLKRAQPSRPRALRVVV